MLIAAIATPSTLISDRGVLAVDPEAVGYFGKALIQSLTIASRASVPLYSALRADFVVFRDAAGGNSYRFAHRRQIEVVQHDAIGLGFQGEYQFGQRFHFHLKGELGVSLFCRAHGWTTGQRNVINP